MVTAPDSSSDNHSPTSAPPFPAVSGDSNSPKFPPKTLTSPWAQVVRGGDGESTTPVPQSPPLPPPTSSSSSSSSSSIAPDQLMSSDSVDVAADGDGNEGNVDRYKKSAWKKPSNGVVFEAGLVMGDESWPALSESTKVSGKLQSDSSSSKAAAEGSSLSSSQAPVTSHSPQKQASSNAKPNSATNYNMPNRQRSMKRGGDSNIGSGPALSSFSNPSPPPLSPPFPVYQVHPGGYGIPDHSPRDHYRNNNWDTRPPAGGFVPTMNEHQGSSRRGNFGPHLRGDSSYHNNYGSRRDQDRRSYANTRDTNVHQPRMPPPRGILRHPPPNTAGFVGPQPIGGPYPNPFGFPEFHYFPTPLFDHFKGMPFFTHGPPSAMFFPAEESPLTNVIVKQIDYYFSEANLVKDDFLKSHMDEQGWVPVTLIADFPRVKSLTDNIQVILDSMRTSIVVEVQGDKLRRRNEWKKYLPSAKLQTESGSISPSAGSRNNNVAVDFQTMTLNKTTTKEEAPTEASNQS
ncbi:hypothetical protein Lal_00029091 [Lupinus albus]|uniref:Putative winged helix-turn-helix DNA-binding domain-containing protein n=1 Tax=Lupinus albus TaxID=3870 RepID=A0A6A4NUB0_LUPAL|nr:putative winged helix-turn-helix DNA-binding domain-containing protein [Lupinus albus]KAF1885202.1 hypothetical protein Lal_00029091 [Lupinus albus]